MIHIINIENLIWRWMHRLVSRVNNNTTFIHFYFSFFSHTVLHVIMYTLQKTMSRKM